MRPKLTGACVWLVLANVYGLGDSERVIGNWFKKMDRTSVVIATKVRGCPAFRSSMEVHRTCLSRVFLFRWVFRCDSP
jgi:aryl-alcohol dehydrogenase-like predicted oxidoreductase